jgi:hypothetical protein
LVLRYAALSETASQSAIAADPMKRFGECGLIVPAVIVAVPRH